MKQNHTIHLYLSFFDPLKMKAKSKFESSVVRTWVDAKQVPIKKKKNCESTNTFSLMSYSLSNYDMFYLQVVECVNSDALVVKTADGVQKKIHFSSLRPPRYCSCNQLNSSIADFVVHVFFLLKYSRIFHWF